MQETLLRELQNLRAPLRRRWEGLLRAEPVTSPLGHPDSLIYLMDWTLDQLFLTLRKGSPRRTSRQRSGIPRCEQNQLGCLCGGNPLLAYFRTAERALIEITLPLLPPTSRDLTLNELSLALHHIAKREVETICAVCQRRPEENVLPARRLRAERPSVAKS